MAYRLTLTVQLWSWAPQLESMTQSTAEGTGGEAGGIHCTTLI